MENMVHEMSCDVISALPRLIKEKHIEGLSQMLIPEPRVERYRPLRWFINNFDIPIILGDIGCMFEVTGAKRYKALDFSNDEIINVLLPIANKKMLIGTSLPNYPEIF